MTALCLGFSIIHGFAAEPITTVAMVRHASKRVTSIEATKTNSRIASPTITTNSPATNRPPPVIDPEKFASARVQLSTPSEPTRSSSPIQLNRRNPVGEGTLKGWASAQLEAGYGTPLADLPVPLHGRNGTAWEEPSYGYLMVRFTF